LRILRKPNQWYTYRVICKSSSFDAFQNEVPADITVVAGHLESRGKLALSMPDGLRSEITFRNIRIRETVKECCPANFPVDEKLVSLEPQMQVPVTDQAG
jgi:hypothetical protein